jgi:hypothetical protein
MKTINRKTLFEILFVLVVIVLVVLVVARIYRYNALALNYWDGSTHPGRPIVSLYGEISRAALIEFRNCGLGENEIVQLLKDAYGHGNKFTITYYDSEGRSIYRASRIGAYGDAYEVTCTDLR